MVPALWSPTCTISLPGKGFAALSVNATGVFLSAGRGQRLPARRYSEDFLDHEIAEGGDALGVAQFFGIGEENRDFFRFDFGQTRTSRGNPGVT